MVQPNSFIHRQVPLLLNVSGAPLPDLQRPLNSFSIAENTNDSIDDGQHYPLHCLRDYRDNEEQSFFGEKSEGFFCLRSNDEDEASQNEQRDCIIFLDNEDSIRPESSAQDLPRSVNLNERASFEARRDEIASNERELTINSQEASPNESIRANKSKNTRNMLQFFWKVLRNHFDCKCAQKETEILKNYWKKVKNLKPSLHTFTRLFKEKGLRKELRQLLGSGFLIREIAKSGINFQLKKIYMEYMSTLIQGFNRRNIKYLN